MPFPQSAVEVCLLCYLRVQVELQAFQRVMVINDNSVLIVAFDGLDHELIQRYDCTTFLDMKEFGRINNHTGISDIYTSELFASFITGETHDVHGVTGLRTWTNPRIGKIERVLQRLPVVRRTNGLRTAIWESVTRLNAQKRKYKKDDLQCSTLFDTVPDSKPLFVPAYNPSWLWMTGGVFNALDYGASIEDTANTWEREHRWRRQRLWSAIDEEYPLLMLQFHKPDILQHLYAPDNTVRHEHPVRRLYKEMDRLAADILDRAEDHYDTVLFMSDHGLPTENAHNENAFYAVNQDTRFDTPHITDFHDWILQQTGNTAASTQAVNQEENSDTRFLENTCDCGRPVAVCDGMVLDQCWTCIRNRGRRGGGR